MQGMGTRGLCQAFLQDEKDLEVHLNVLWTRLDQVKAMSRQELEQKGVMQELDSLSAHPGHGNMEDFAEMHWRLHRVFQALGMPVEAEPALATSPGQPA